MLFAVQCISDTIHLIGPLQHVHQLQAVQIRIAVGILCTGNIDLVLQCQVAVILDCQRRQLVCSTRLPQDFLTSAASGFYEAQGLAFHGITILVQQLHVQLTGLNLVDAGAGRVGEPRKCSAHQHDHAHDQRHDAGQQRPFGCFAIIHVFVPLLLKFYSQHASFFESKE